MRVLRNRRASVLATVTGIIVGIAGVLVFIRFGPPVGAESPNPAERANTGSATGKSPRPPVGMPSFPGLPGHQSGSGPSAGSPSVSAGPSVDGPTDNLRKVKAAARFAYKSTTGVYTVPPGLNLTGTVEISVLWDEGSARPTRATQNYNNATGNRSVFLFPAEAGPRTVSNVVSLREIGVDGAVNAVRSNVAIYPLYDVTVSPLTFTLRDDCDAVGDSEIVIQWRSAKGGLSTHEISMSEGQVRTVAAVGATYEEVGHSTQLKKPVFIFYEDDQIVGGTRSFGFPEVSGPLLALGKDLVIDLLRYARNDGRCEARIQYSITFRLREYLYLE
jgi:hypothetical protein